jgi:hypothetical protein
MGFAVPEKAVIGHRDVVGCSLPLAHQDGARSRDWFGWKLGRIVAAGTGKQPVEFLGDRLGQAAVAPFLPRIGNAERQNVTAQRWGWLLGKLFCPKCPQFGARQLFKVFEVDDHIPVVRHGGSPEWPDGIAAIAPVCAGRRDRLAIGRSAAHSESRRLAARLAFPRGSFDQDAVNTLGASLVGHERLAEPLAHHAGKKAAYRVLLPASCLHDGRDGRALLAVEHFDHAGLLRIP